MFKKISLGFILMLTISLAVCQLQVHAGDVINASGKVKDVDLEDKSLVIGMESSDQVFYIEDSSKIHMNSQKMELKDVQIGMVVEIQYIKSNDDNIVHSVMIVP